MQILRTTQRLSKETVQYEAPNGHDAQGAPSYATAVDLSAHLVFYDSRKGEEYVIAGDGKMERVALTLFVQGDSAVVPQAEGRVTVDSTDEFNIMEVVPVHGLLYDRTQLDHYRVRCKVA